MSARPGESVIYYQLLNGCPALVVPVKVGAPLIAWDGLTLEHLWKVKLPEGDKVGEPGSKFEGIVSVLYEFLDMCVDWARVILEPAGREEEKGSMNEKAPEDEKKDAVKAALRLFVAGAIRSGESKAVKDEVEKERSGIAMWRIP